MKTTFSFISLARGKGGGKKGDLKCSERQTKEVQGKIYEKKEKKRWVGMSIDEKGVATLKLIKDRLVEGIASQPLAPIARIV